MIMLLSARLPIPPSVNNRVIISRHGGTTHPQVVQYQEDCNNILCSNKETWQDGDAICEASKTNAGLFVIMRFGLPQHKTLSKRGMYEVRDLDNMAQVPLNAIKSHIGIDDRWVVDLWLSKRPLPFGAAAFLQVTVLAIKKEDLSDEEYENEPLTQIAAMARPKTTGLSNPA